MVGSVDPIVEFEAAFNKSIRLFLATLVVGGLFPIGVLGFLFFADPGGVGAWFLFYIVGDLVLTVVGVRWFRKRLEHVRNMPRTMRHRLASFGAGKGSTLIFDNGLVMTSGLQFRLFGSPMGGKMIPSLEEVTQLERGIIRMRPALRVFRHRGPESLRRGLDLMQQALNAGISNLFVFLPRPSAPPDARRASWVSTARFGAGFRQLDSERILQQIDSIASLLEDAATMARDQRV
jgi:hypothetical protein